MCKSPLLCLAALFAANTFAAPPPETAKTNVLQDIWSVQTPHLDALEQIDAEPSFKDDYWRKVIVNAHPILDSRIGYPSGLRTYIDSLHHTGSDWIESQAHTGARAVRSLLGDELRDSLAARLEISEPDSWSSSRTLDWMWRHTMSLLDSSLAHSSERRQRLSVYSSEDEILEDDAWQEAHPHGWIPRPGIRPIETRPYAYLESNIGRQPGGLPIAYFDLRGYTDLESLDHFGRFKAEAIARFPVDHLFQLTVGFSGYPLESASEQRWSEIIRFDCPIRSLDGIFSFGTRFNDRDQRVLSQFSMTF